jgi:hypothetical protein
MKNTVFLSCKVILLVIVLSLIIIEAGSAYDLKEYYPLGEGDHWLFSTLEEDKSFEEAIKVEGKEMVDGVESIKIVDANGDYRSIAFDSEGLKKYKSFDDGENGFFIPAELIFPNDAGIGEKKDYVINYATYNSDGAKTREVKIAKQIYLESKEDLEVPAGRFSNCLKFSIVQDEEEASGSHRQDSCSIWLAPGVGRAKEFCVTRKYSSEGNDEGSSIEMTELISAVINGKRIGVSQFSN